MRLLFHSETWLGVATSIDGLAVIAVGNKAASETERGFVGMDEEGVQVVGVVSPVMIFIKVSREPEPVRAGRTVCIALPRQLPLARERPVIVHEILLVGILLLSVDGDEFAGLPFAHSREGPVCAERQPLEEASLVLDVFDMPRPGDNRRVLLPQLFRLLVRLLVSPLRVAAARGEDDEGIKDGDDVFLFHFVLSYNFPSVLDEDATPWHFYLSALEVVGRDGRRV